MPSAPPLNHVMDTEKQGDGTQSKVCVRCQLRVPVGDVSFVGNPDHPLTQSCNGRLPTLKEYVELVLLQPWREGLTLEDLHFFVNGRLVEYRNGGLWYPQGGEMVRRHLLLHDSLSVIGARTSNPLFLFAGRHIQAEELENGESPEDGSAFNDLRSEYEEGSDEFPAVHETPSSDDEACSLIDEVIGG